jgi:ComF family protein
LHNLFIKVYCNSCGFPTELKTNYCKNCTEKRHFNYTYYNFYYKDVIRTIIREIKFNNNVKAIFFLKSLCKKILRADLIRRYDIITVVPTHWLRRLKRLIHPADIIAKELSKRLNIPYKVVLKRKRLTEYQWMLKKKERSKNVRGSFKLCYEVKGLNILLIDDIYTSGATAFEASRVLKRAGANVIDCYILARSIK